MARPHFPYTRLHRRVQAQQNSYQVAGRDTCKGVWRGKFDQWFRRLLLLTKKFNILSAGATFTALVTQHIWRHPAIYREATSGTGNLSHLNRL